jgi:hypothetical protein
VDLALFRKPYLVRIVSASLLVSYMTINVVRGSDDASGKALRAIWRDSVWGCARAA